MRWGLKLSAQARATARPVGTLPVNATMWVPRLSTSLAPTRPRPVTHCTTPGPRPSNASTKRSVLRLVYSDGLTTTALPAASAAAASQHSRTYG